MQGSPPGYQYPPQPQQPAPQPQQGFAPPAPQGYAPPVAQPAPQYAQQPPPGYAPQYPPQYAQQPAPAPGGYPGAPAANGQAAPLTQAQIAAMFGGVDAAKPKYETQYFAGDDNLEGDYVVALDSVAAFTCNNPNGYSGLATVLKFQVVESTQPGNPPGVERGIFCKSDPSPSNKYREYAYQTLRNFTVSVKGWDETRDAAHIAQFVAQNGMGQMLAAMASDPANAGGFKGIRIRLAVRQKQGRPTAQNPQGNAYATYAFSPYIEGAALAMAPQAPPAMQPAPEYAQQPPPGYAPQYAPPVAQPAPQYVQQPPPGYYPPR